MTGQALLSDTLGAAASAGAEQERLDALQRYDILDTPAEQSFDRVTALARQLFGMPVALVTLIDGHRQWFKSRQGLAMEETSRASAICSIAIQGREPLVIEDVCDDPRLADGACVTEEPFVRFYAGAPLITPDGHAIGTLSVMDHVPRRFGRRRVAALKQLAGIVMDEIELRLAANSDSLTGALSRRAFRNEGERAALLAARHGHELSLIVIDLDHFKRVNDTHGHPAGDAVLARSVASCLCQLRKSDMMGRLGGEEFAVLLPYSGARSALEVAERLRMAIAAERFETRGGRSFSVTASLGVVGRSDAAPGLDEMIREADAALYAAKTAGRDRCVLAAARSCAPSEVGGQRVLKSGRIVFGEDQAIDCTVRALSRNGASLDVLAADAVPESFRLSVEADQLFRRCRVVRQAERKVEVEFA